VAELVGLLNVVTAELVDVIGEVVRTGAWEGFGIRSPEHWVVWRCGVSPGRARRLVRIARALDALPPTSSQFRAGSSSTRDGGCRVPGCAQVRWLHIHHLRHWTRGGRTDPGNLFALCPAHHRMVH